MLNRSPLPVYALVEGLHPHFRRPARPHPLRAVMLDSIARDEADPGSAEAEFLAQLVAALETPIDRLLARFRGRPAGPGRD